MATLQKKSESGQQSVMEVPLHPVQLQRVLVRELFIKAYRIIPLDFVPPDGDVRLDSGFNEYDPENKILYVHARVFIGDENDLSREEEAALVSKGELSLRMKVHVVGQYTVDENRFPLDMLEDFAKKGGAMTLFPYVREHVYSLSARCGLRPIILPVMQLQTVKLVVPSSEQASISTGTVS